MKLSSSLSSSILYYINLFNVYETFIETGLKNNTYIYTKAKILRDVIDKLWERRHSIKQKIILKKPPIWNMIFI